MSRNATILLTAVMLIAAFLRFWNLDITPPGLHPDEAMNGNNAVEAFWARDWKVFYPDNFGREGLFINIQSLFVAVFGGEPWALRLPSAIFGTFTVLGIFFLTELLFRGIGRARGLVGGIMSSEIVGLLAAFFTATSFWHINFSRLGFRAITAPFFLVWGLYFFFRFYKNIGSGNSQTFSAAIGGFLFGLGAHSYIAYRIAPLLLIWPIYMGLKEYFRTKPPINLAAGPPSGTKKGEGCFPCMLTLFLFFAFIAVLPLGMYFLEHPEDFFGRTSKISIFIEDSPLGTLAENIVKTIGMFWVWGDNNWRHNFAAAPQLALPVGILFLLGIIFAARNTARRGALARPPEKFAAAFMLLWLLLMLIPVVISREALPHALRAIIAIPPVMMLTAFGLWNILDRIAQRLEAEKKANPEATAQLVRIGKETAAALLLALAFLVITVADKYLDRWAGHPLTDDAFSARDWRIAEFLRKADPEAEKYIVIKGERIDERIVSISAQSVLFGTGTFLPHERAAKKYFYLSPEELRSRFTASPPANAYIVFLKEDDRELIRALSNVYPAITASAPRDFALLRITP